mmetsp:Transcript_30575/g.79745  ORF Transcript_30575/g.79745 Transcript_30575/m.79745 type:complete len:213 (-) Transcript_30575:6834-7472(-)
MQVVSISPQRKKGLKEKKGKKRGKKRQSCNTIDLCVRSHHPHLPDRSGEKSGECRRETGALKPRKHARAIFGNRGGRVKIGCWKSFEDRDSSPRRKNRKMCKHGWVGGKDTMSKTHEKYTKEKKNRNLRKMGTWDLKGNGNRTTPERNNTITWCPSFVVQRTILEGHNTKAQNWRCCASSLLFLFFISILHSLWFQLFVFHFLFSFRQHSVM